MERNDLLTKYIVDGIGTPREVLAANFNPITAKVMTREDRDRRLGINPKARCSHCGVKGHSFCHEGEGGIFGKN